MAVDLLQRSGYIADSILFYIVRIISVKLETYQVGKPIFNIPALRAGIDQFYIV